jgi:uncharacterized protein (TIGR03067 family)
LLGADGSGRAPADAEARADLTRLEGDWYLASARRNGKDMPADTVKTFRCTVRGDHFSITRDGKVVEAGTLRPDPSKSPKAVDIAVDNGPTVLGIYDVEADGYRQCYATPGKGRPTSFDAAEGSGHSLSVWRRKGTPKPKPAP